MKLVIFAISSLSRQLILRNSMPIFNALNVSHMQSVASCSSVSAWTSIWTGTDPSYHGIISNFSLVENGKFGSMNRKALTNEQERFDKIRIWEHLGNENLNCVAMNIPFSSIVSNKRKLKDKIRSVHRKVESYLDVKLDEIDVLILGFNELGEIGKTFGLISDELQEAASCISDCILYFNSEPIIIISELGLNTVSQNLNLSLFLRQREYFSWNEQGKPDLENSMMYPVDCGSHKTLEQDWGIYLNRNSVLVKSDKEALNIAGEIIAALNEEDGIYADVTSRFYDETGIYFSEIPDIIVTSAGARVLINSDANDTNERKSFSPEAYSRSTIFASNFGCNYPSKVENIFKYLCASLKVSSERE